MSRHGRHGQVAPCACGLPPLAPRHLEWAATDVVCAARIADVRLLARLLDEQRGLSPDVDDDGSGPTASALASGLGPSHLEPASPLAEPGAA